MFKIPSLLSYPEVAHVDDCAEIRGIFCYIVEAYKPGFSALVKLRNDESWIAIGDWSGVRVTPKHEGLWEKSAEFLKHSAYPIIQMMRRIRLDQAEFYFAADGSLVDVQLSLNKFIGPGMLRDVFSASTETQKIHEIAVLNDDKLKELSDSDNNFIVKPSRYRHYVQGEDILPLYARI
ncbi:MAG: hypothetical protein QF535_15270 [Anaerolineales bacterium]|jgi:hypothetical protein|nr:hypothetical protein [Anaerolineales bacterium]